ncbi:hypothetical protein CVT25_008714 [Psilocybe cyanescens]|uniref:DUF7719 domain-containing protein n=1 Tax=Psilocybe cyanescens TaxID=93625 RepID=A0A409XNQ7_PSICY|nr:hypothetical protein CVT25_008714 [Psilocybe cyanescens]
MTRSRKNPKSIPLVSPSSVKVPSGSTKPLVDISEDEQWRLINQSGILQSSALHATAADGSTESPLADEIFNALLLIIPFSSLLLLMEILIRHQYGKTASFEVIMDRMLPGVPILSIFIFYTTRYKQQLKMQILLFILSVTVGCRMLYLLDNASWLVNMNQASVYFKTKVFIFNRHLCSQCPPLATIWIYTVLQLDLGAAIAGLLTIGAFVWYNNIRLQRQY